MNFDQSGLPPIQLVQDAFTYSHNYIKATRGAMLKDFERQINRAHRENVTMLEQARSKGQMDEAQYKRELSELENMRNQQLKAGPMLIARELDRLFAKNHVNPARELFRHAERATPEMLAAIMLTECIRSPRDFRAIEGQFGPVVANTLADLLHLEAYTEERRANFAAVPDDVKRAYYAMTISSLENISDQAQQLAKRSPTRRIVFPEGQEDMLFQNTKVVWGIDKKLDARMLEVFNRTAGHVMSKVRFARNQDGDLTLVPHVPPTPPAGGKNLPAVRKPPGNGSIGGDVF